MQNIKEQSLLVSAIRVLSEKKEPIEFYTLFGIVCAEKDYNDAEKAELITRFYTDITTSAKFVYTGDNKWDLKEHQKTELWEKDGSFFKEYTEIFASDYKDVVEQPKAKKVVEKVEVTEVVVPVVKPTKEEILEKVKAKVKAKKNKPKIKEEISEDGFVEYEDDASEEIEDDFDEEKYNEYMDTYEDQYED